MIKRGAVLEVSSPTAQPWIDTNLALVRIEQRENPEQVPLYTFSWKASESGQPQAPTATDYSLAIAEAGAFHADMILNLDDTLQKALSENDAKAWALWNQVKPYVAFSSHASAYGGREPVANVAIVVGSFDSADEPMNLLARHNIPFKVFQLADLKSSGLENFDVVVVFAKPDQELCARLAASAGNGNIVVLIDTHGSYSWQTAESVRLNEHAVSYTVGSGRVIELSEPVIDPETFAQDIRRLLGKQKLSMSLWNAITTLAVPSGEHGRIRTLELVNYAADPLRLQVRVKGSFTSIRYETPEHGCCIVVAGEQRDGFTEFVVPDLRIAGRVRLEDSSSARHRR